MLNKVIFSVFLVLTAIALGFYYARNDRFVGLDSDTGVTFGIDMARPEDIAPEDWKRFVMLFLQHAANNAPINFYARVVDQNNDPVPGAKVNVHYIYFIESLAKQWSSNLEADETVRVELISDAEGRVELTDAKGSILYIDSIVKDGYIYPEKTFVDFPYAPDFRDGAILPTKENPYLARLWLKRTACTTVLKELVVNTIADGTPVHIDLMTASKTPNAENADIVIRTTADSHELGKRYGWQASLSCPGGGMVETDGKLFYQAPKSGYQKDIAWTVGGDEDSFSMNIEKCLYLQLRDSKIYCAARLTIYAYHDGTGRVRIKYVINETGSRNLANDRW